MDIIQNTFTQLKPFLIGIRHLEGTLVIDVLLKKNWTYNEDDNITIVKSKDENNYIMLFPANKETSIDYVIDFVRKIIKFNLDEESKHKLFQDKIITLKEIFKLNDLDTLSNLEFKIGGDKEQTLDHHGVKLDDDDSDEESELASTLEASE